MAPKETVEHHVGRFRSHLPPFANDLIDRLREAEVLFYAAGLAFYGLISLAPFLVVSFWIIGMLAGEDRVVSLTENLAEMAPGDAEVEPVIENLLDAGSRVGVIALVAALWPATAYGSGLVRALDRLSPAEDRPVQGLRGRIKTLSLLLALPVLLLGAMATSYLLPGMLGDGALLAALGWGLAILAGTTVTAIAIIGIYLLFGPDSLSWRSFALSAAGAALAVTITSIGYLVYLDQGADWEERVAGSGLAAVVLLGLWLYLTNIILLTGYSVSLSWDQRYTDPGSSGTDSHESDRTGGERPDRERPVTERSERPVDASGDVGASARG
jgi:membrane protein